MINIIITLIIVTLLAMAATFLAIQTWKLVDRVKKLEAWIKASYHSEMDELLTFGAEEAEE